MFAALLNAEWSHMRDSVSGAFFDVIPAISHKTLVTCRDSGASLNPGSATLGLLLACIYETLELRGGTFDVRAALENTVAH
jgi:hypothetical protein